ncbi:MAG: protease modulator HflC [Sphingomonadaceae bacterium]|uniref:protease modulator HflC n=1 Tax=Thermaurantiacus sp. TaxID=2820283 RepID=UPI00298EDE7E|nr:protease modulator HflC [Thermaurantiacus sp.]MCS6986638.1 protease modulator HflC [Sphingomonadaceae bacterium]MDW8414100.1 protease modulator HflC [Thermaurantiacus sp.]
MTIEPRRLATLGLGGLLLLILLSSSLFRVPEHQQAIILQLSKPVATVNTYEPNEVFGRTGAGLMWKIPFLQEVLLVDKRILSLDVPPQTVLSTDQLRLVVDAFARFRVVDPVRMYQTVRTEERLAEELSRILTSLMRNELGKQRFDTLLSPERGQLMEAIQANVNRAAAAYGAEIIDVRIKRADLPPGSPLEAAYERMRTARQEEALAIRAQGAKDAQIIRAEADAAAARTYAESFGKDPEFYAFWRAMQAYRTTFAEGNTTVVLSPDSEFLREFEGRRAR